MQKNFQNRKRHLCYNWQNIPKKKARRDLFRVQFLGSFRIIMENLNVTLWNIQASVHIYIFPFDRKMKRKSLGEKSKMLQFSWHQDTCQKNAFIKASNCMKIVKTRNVNNFYLWRHLWTKMILSKNFQGLSTYKVTTCHKFGSASRLECFSSFPISTFLM